MFSPKDSINMYGSPNAGCDDDKGVDFPFWISIYFVIAHY